MHFDQIKSMVARRKWYNDEYTDECWEFSSWNSVLLLRWI